MTSDRKLAPIGLFAYNRPDHLRQTVAALAENALAADSDLYVFLDGAKNEADRDAIDAIRQYIPKIQGFRTVSLIAQEKNQGLSKSIIGGVSYLLNLHDRVIVLEDDIVTSASFLEYMNKGLDMYASDSEVASIHGFMYGVDGLPDTFFLRGADCWGWATWRRAWQLFNSNGNELLKEFTERGLSDEFDLGGAVQNVQMLRDQIHGQNDSWAIRWHASMFLQNKLTLHPGRSLIHNIGLDGSGTHCQDAPLHLAVKNSDRPVCMRRLSLVEDPVARKKVAAFLSSKLVASRPKGIFEMAAKSIRLIFSSR